MINDTSDFLTRGTDDVQKALDWCAKIRLLALNIQADDSFTKQLDFIEKILIAQQQTVNEWQPIETADKQRKSEEDHVNILLWDGIRQAVGYWDDTSYSKEEFVKETKSGKRVYQMVEYVSGYWNVEGDFLSPTHWMSLPKPPRAEQKGGE